jgi:multiple sugar transport system substrate-binding protein
MSGLTRREALALLGGLGGAGLLSTAGCTITRGEPPINTTGLDKKPAPGRKTNIELYSLWGGSIGSGWIKIAEAFEASHPDIGVRVVFAPAGTDGTQQKLFTAISSGNPPDIAQLIPHQTPQWAELGVMRDLTDDFRAAGITQQDFFPPAWECMVYKDRIWSVQRGIDPNFPFFWNKNLFAESGLDPERPPKTIEELDEFSRQILRKKGNTVTKIGAVPWDVYGMANSIFTWGWAFGGEFYDRATDTITPDHELVVDALQWMVNYAKAVGGAERVVHSPPGLQLHWFSTGTVGMAPLVAQNYRDIRAELPDLEIGAGQLPYQPPGASRAGAGAWAGGWGYFVPAGSRQPEAAFEFIRWVSATAEGTKLQWENVGVVPSWRDAPVLAEIKNDELMAPYYDVAVTATHTRPPMLVADFYFQKFAEEVERALHGLVTPIEALRAVKDDTLVELDRFRREVVR